MARPRHSTTPATPGRLRAGLALAALLAVVTVAALALADTRIGGAAAQRVAFVAAPQTMPANTAEALARRIRAVHDDVTATWRHDFRWRLGRAYLPPEVVTFVDARPSPCAGANVVVGLAYCPLDRTLSVDLAFLARVEAQLRGEGKRAIALLVARLAAEHVQAELAILGDADRRRPALDRDARRALDAALVLQADCFAGVWARRAEPRVGTIEPDAWGRVVAAARLAAPEAAAAARLDLDRVAAREAAFAAGYEDGQLRACLGPDISGVLG